MPTNSFKSKSANFAFCEGELVMKSPTPPTRSKKGERKNEHLAETQRIGNILPQKKTCPYAYATGICIKTRDHLPSAISSYVPKKLARGGGEGREVSGM